MCVRDRLHGTLSAPELVSSRATATIVAGALATAGGAPYATELVGPPAAQAAASVPGEQTPGPPDGIAEDPSAEAEDASDPSIEETPTAGGSGPVIVEGPEETPILEADDPVTADEPSLPPAAPSGSSSAPAPAASPTAPSRPVAPVAAPAPTAQGLSAPLQPKPTAALPGSERRSPRPSPPRESQGALTRVEVQELAAVERLPAAAAPAPPPAIDSSPTASERALPRAGRTYTVAPGDSLWSIARRLLPAGSSDAAVAKLVSQIWELNAERIGTGDPDLLRLGQTLALPRVPA